MIRGVKVGVWLLMFVLLCAVGCAERGRNESAENLRKIMLSILLDEKNTMRFPRRAIFDQDGKPLLSWRVEILPFLHKESLYNQFHLDEPWDSEHNIKLIDKMPDVFKDPQIVTGTGMTVYQAVVGKWMAFEGDKQLRLGSFADGIQKTVGVVEVAPQNAVPWTKPADWEIDINDPLKGLADVPPGAFQVAFIDGHVETIDRAIQPDLLNAMFTRNGGDWYPLEVVPHPGEPPRPSPPIMMNHIRRSILVRDRCDGVRRWLFCGTSG